MVDVSIILVNYKTTNYLIHCLNSILTNTKDISFEIKIIDNHSGKDEVDLLKNTFSSDPRIDVFSLNKNLGFAKANNYAIKYCQSKYLFFLNPDTLIVNNAIKIMTDYLESSPNDIAGLGTNLTDQSGSPQLSYGYFPSIKEELYELVYKILVFKKYKKKSAIMAADFSGEVDYVNGADLFVSSDTFNKIGLFDENFFLYFEEADWCKRAKKFGYKNWIISGPEIIHIREGSVKQTPALSKMILFEKSKQYFFKKHYGWPSLIFLKIITFINSLKAFLWSFQINYLILSIRQFYSKDW